MKGIDDMAVRSPKELEKIPFVPGARELRGSGVDFWKSWKAKNHFDCFTEEKLRERSDLSTRVLDSIKKVLGLNSDIR
ncbi:MAG: hypothetical protein HOP09_15770 [Hyphomicrobium sp.]|nr:hypothetical protein [Hyphomicrobium sp.]